MTKKFANLRDAMSHDAKNEIAERVEKALDEMPLCEQRSAVMETIGDIRWKQRFQNFEKAFTLLRELEKTSIDDLRPLEQEGFIQRFEYTFELAWKTAKDYLEYSGHVITQASPRPVIKEAFAAGIITDGQTFISMAESRNLLSHTYDAARFKEILVRVKSEYLPALALFYDFLKGLEE